MWTPRFSPIPRMPSYLRVPTSRIGSRLIDRQVKLWSEDAWRPPDVLLRHTHLNGIAGMSWFDTNVYKELHTWKELRGKPKSKSWALALEINYKSSDSKNMGVEFGLVTRSEVVSSADITNSPKHKQICAAPRPEKLLLPHSAHRES